eukprot:21235-Heterococcus_DN1.PRE.2
MSGVRCSNTNKTKSVSIARTRSAAISLAPPDNRLATALNMTPCCCDFKCSEGEPLGTLSES